LLRIAKLLGISTQERRVGRTELYLADEIFYCGTGQEITPVLSVDGKTIGKGVPGELTRTLQSEYDDIVRGNKTASAAWLTPIWQTSSAPSN
jgi:branched-chain amino acid aminotransferase